MTIGLGKKNYWILFSNFVIAVKNITFSFPSEPFLSIQFNIVIYIHSAV